MRKRTPSKFGMAAMKVTARKIPPSTKFRPSSIFFLSLLLLQLVACGGDDESVPPPTVSSCPGGASISASGPEGYVSVSGPPGSRTISAANSDGAINIQGPKPCPTTSPQSVNDVQTAYNSAKQICCSTYAPVAASIVASYPNPVPNVPPVSSVSCDQAIVQAALLGKTVYAPWGGDAYQPYYNYMVNQGKALVSCIGASAGLTMYSNPALLSYVAVASVPTLQAAANGPAGAYYTLGIPYAVQAASKPPPPSVNYPY